MQENGKNDKNKDSIDEIDSRDPMIYEVGYLLVPTIPEENISVIYGNLKELVSVFGGRMISDEIPTMIPLSYIMQKTVQNIRNKYDTAYFGWMKFFMDSEKILELKKKLDLDPNIIRFLIIKTVKENTISAKRFTSTHKDISHKRTPMTKSNETEKSLPIDKEEIDKEIDAMVSENI